MQGKCEIKIKQIPLDVLKEFNSIQQEPQDSCTLFWAEDGRDIQLVFCSNTKQIQALEFMDYFCVQLYKNRQMR